MTQNNYGSDFQAIKASEIGNAKLVAALEAMQLDATEQLSFACKAASNAKIVADFQKRRVDLLAEEIDWVSEALAIVLPPTLPAMACAPAAYAPTDMQEDAALSKLLSNFNVSDVVNDSHQRPLQTEDEPIGVHWVLVNGAGVVLLCIVVGWVTWAVTTSVTAAALATAASAAFYATTMAWVSGLRFVKI